MDKQKKTACVYHSIDLDGWMSAAIVKHWFIKNNKGFSYTINGTKIDRGGSSWRNESITFIGYNYGQPIPDLAEYDEVIMCDISFPIEEMEKLNDKLVYIDHHISAIKDFNTSEIMSCDGIRDTSYAACELTWKYFFPHEPMPEIVRLLGRYDCFGSKGTAEETKVLEFQYGARQCIRNYEEAYKYLISTKDEVMYQSGQYFDNTINQIYDSGKAIYKYLCTEAEQTYKTGFPVFLRYDPNLEEHAKLGCLEHTFYRFLWVNRERFNPINFGIDYRKDGYDGCLSFHYANKKWNCSIYSDDAGVDCSWIAKQYGGGGHKGAAGFTLTSAEFNHIIV